ncbi:MAG: hypothetical protein K6B28_12480 [Lachnospiraceae bacterium]|nr:hypothetical protein [Lachnospiraceae bacterium]
MIKYTIILKKQANVAKKILIKKNIRFKIIDCDALDEETKAKINNENCNFPNVIDRDYTSCVISEMDPKELTNAIEERINKDPRNEAVELTDEEWEELQIALHVHDDDIRPKHK